MTETRETAAQQLKELLTRISPLIEHYTSAVCPECIDVCCRQKHGLYRERDIAYLRALGVAVPERDPARPLEGPCEAMGPRGCVLPRWMRPFKCTWYFCEPLLAALNEGPQREARRLTEAVDEMLRCYDLLEGESGHDR